MGRVPCVVPGHADRHAAPRCGYARDMREMGDHQRDADRLDLGDVPEGEEISEADAAERLDEDPDDQENRQDPVWDDEGHED